jgi:hypothetical protein
MAVTAVFELPATGLVNPAAEQVADRVTFTLNDVVTGDTVITVTHNMNLSAADLAAGFPIVVLQPLRATARSANWVVGTVGTSAGRLANSIGLAKRSEEHTSELQSLS